MPSKPIAPITVKALRNLFVHGSQTITQLRKTLPDLKAKTMGNLVQMSMAIRDDAGQYTITPKGRARLAKVDGPADDSPENNTLVAAAHEAATPHQALLSNAQIEGAIHQALERARMRISLPDIGRRTRLPEHLLRPSLTTMIQAGTVEGTVSKPPLYRLTPTRRSARVAQNHHGEHHTGSARSQLGPHDYIAPELQRSAGIAPERFIAFTLPSRMGNRLHWPDGRVTRVDEHPGMPA